MSSTHDPSFVPSLSDSSTEGVAESPSSAPLPSNEDLPTLISSDTEASPAFKSEEAPPDLQPNTPGEVWGWTKAVTAFLSFSSPRLLLGGMAIVALIRLGSGAVGLLDFAVVAVLLAVWPVQEWLIHVFLLHLKPMHIAGITLDLPSARRHRRHHRNPRVLAWSFMPLPGIVIGAIVHGTLWHWLLPAGPAWTAILAVLALALHYEWVHVMSHMPYRPRLAWYRRLQELHRLHHYRNEQHWYGVSMVGGDWLLGTGGAKGDVPRSATCMTLGVEEEPRPMGLFFD